MSRELKSLYENEKVVDEVGQELSWQANMIVLLAEIRNELRLIRAAQEKQ